VQGLQSEARRQPTEIRCHRCSHYLGESAEAMEFVGVVKLRDLRDVIPPPRSSWKCRCGWDNIYVPPAAKVA